MNNQLIAVKFFHTVIWFILASATIYVFFSGLFDRITVYTWISVAMVIMEGVILVIFKWSCPLTGIARKYSDSPKDNFDIYLPNWLAKYNKQIFTTIFVIGLVLVLFRLR